MVAKSVLGFSFSLKILLAALPFSSLSFAKSLCVKEKKAISELETIAEAYNNKTISNNALQIFAVKRTKRGKKIQELNK